MAVSGSCRWLPEDGPRRDPLPESLFLLEIYKTKWKKLQNFRGGVGKWEYRIRFAFLYFLRFVFRASTFWKHFCRQKTGFWERKRRKTRKENLWKFEPGLKARLNLHTVGGSSKNFHLLTILIVRRWKLLCIFPVFLYFFYSFLLEKHVVKLQQPTCSTIEARAKKNGQKEMVMTRLFVVACQFLVFHILFIHFYWNNMSESSTNVWQTK